MTLEGQAKIIFTFIINWLYAFSEGSNPLLTTFLTLFLTCALHSARRRGDTPLLDPSRAAKRLSHPPKSTTLAMLTRRKRLEGHVSRPTSTGLALFILENLSRIKSSGMPSFENPHHEASNGHNQAQSHAAAGSSILLRSRSHLPTERPHGFTPEGCQWQYSSEIPQGSTN